jgi:flagellar biosynthetic protein FlhB
MSGDKTEEPTEHKLREARKKGQLAKSQDIIGAAIFMTGFFVLYFLGYRVSDGLEKLMRISIKATGTSQIDNGVIFALMEIGLNTMFEVIAPLCAVAFVMAILSNYVQVGTLITFEPLKPQLKKLNPIEGLKGMFKLRKVIELVKSTLKLGIVSVVAYMIVSDAVPMIVMSIQLPLWQTIGMVWDLVFKLCVRVGVIFAVLAAADYAYQKWQYKKDMMMSKKDIKDEYKNQEGDPFIKGQRKQLHQEMAMTSASEDTRKADAVIVNPDHIAVAIKYDEEEMGAPRILSKGNNQWAERIKAVAKEEGIPILRNVPLAAALNDLEVGEEIPEELYDAVAEILQFVYQLAEERGEVD